MNLKTCKLIQKIAVGLAAAALLIVLLSVPFKNVLINIAYPGFVGETGYADVQKASAFPLISLTAAVICLGIAVCHLSVLNTHNKNYIFISVVICSSVFLIYKLISPALNNAISNGVLERNADAIANYQAYAMLENIVYGIIPFLTVPASILTFIVFGACLGKGIDVSADEQADSINKGDMPAILEPAPAKPSEDTAAEPSQPVEPAPAKPEAKKIKLPGLDEQEMAAAKEEYNSAFKRPKDGAAAVEEKAESNDPDAYFKAFQRPKDK